MSTRVAVVTGANKGIGLAMVRALCKQFDGDVYLTARNEERGKKAVEDLEKEGLHPKFLQLDITSQESIEVIKKTLVEHYGALDVLINNAGIHYSQANDPTPIGIQAHNTITTNFTGTRNICQELFPILRPQSRVVHISSEVCELSFKGMSKDLQMKLTSPALTEHELAKIMENFVHTVEQDIYKAAGYPSPVTSGFYFSQAYGVSKIGVSLLAELQAKCIMKKGILINSCCPGWTRTDLGGNRAPQSPDEATETPMYLALLPPKSDGPHGKMFRNKTIYNWHS
ncbi:carbonyl reductase [NADPH] 1-like [Saccoglossus kowalevskii]|uniref:carbonyl reductase (NADPH) n=1 Tax=Saccoglossus kowalevskii TaxID=10224 RepID=A0ABM0GVU4_SACKO|nr:PREDICTED: carbonyl reductase [NADPH] 1-like [Saccoglossus kowalevskii]